jgi:hypothetical protein
MECVFESRKNVSETLFLTALVTVHVGNVYRVHLVATLSVLYQVSRRKHKVTRSVLVARPGCVGFMVDYVALGQFCLQVLRVSSVCFIPPLLSSHLHLNTDYQKDKLVMTGNTLRK